MALEIMMSLGSFKFSLATAAYQQLERSTAYTWAAQSRFGQADALQSTGPGADTISLPGVVYPEFRGGTGQITAMRALAGKALPLTLIDGRGNMMGDWVIESIDDTGSVFAAAGVARKQEFTLKLRLFPADPAALKVIPMTPGVLPTSSLLSSAGQVAITAGKGPTSLLSSLNGSVASITGFAGQIGSQTQGILSAVGKGMSAARNLQHAGTDTARLLDGVRSLSALPDAMTSLARIGTGVSQSAGAASSLLARAGAGLQKDGVDPAAVKAVQDHQQGQRAGRPGAHRGAALPANIAIELPALAPATTPGVKLWD